MNLINFITILIFILSLFLLLWLWLILRKRDTFSIWTKKGTMIFKLDPFTRNVSSYKLEKLYEAKPGSKISESNTLKLFGLMNNNPQGNKLFRQAIHDIGNGQEEVKYNFTVRSMGSHKDNKINFDVLIRKIVDVSDYLIIVKWQIINIIDSKNAPLKVSALDKIIENPTNFKGFIAFDLNQKIPFAQEQFLKYISPIFKSKKYDLFIYSGLVIIVCYARTYKQVKKMTLYVTKYVELKKRKLGLGQLIEASGSARFQNILNKKDMNKVLATLNFIINLSLKWHESFVDLKIAQNFKSEFIAFNEASRKFRDLLRLHEFNHQFIIIKSLKSQRKVIGYIRPNLKSFDKYEIQNILLSSYNAKLLVDSNLEKFLNQNAKWSTLQKGELDYLDKTVENKPLTHSNEDFDPNNEATDQIYNINEPVLIDVNASWLINNFQKLQPEKDFYIIKLDNYSLIDNLKLIAVKLKDAKVNLGLRVDEFSNFFITFIQQIKFQIVIIDQKLIEENNFNNTMHHTKLLSFKNIFEQFNIKVVFENLSPQITNEIATNLGIKYYYIT